MKIRIQAASIPVAKQRSLTSLYFCYCHRHSCKNQLKSEPVGKALVVDCSPYPFPFSVFPLAFPLANSGGLLARFLSTGKIVILFQSLGGVTILESELFQFQRIQ